MSEQTIVPNKTVRFLRARQVLADGCCRLACWLRGEKWYVGEAWHAVPGNRAADLEMQIWQDVVLISYPPQEEDEDAVNRIQKNLSELAQSSGAAWGHIWPKQSK